jgi:ABC-type lipopolysaccharide export system ATPase subunit
MSGTLAINHVSQSYGAREVLNDISFHLRDGMIACSAPAAVAKPPRCAASPALSR